MENPKLQSLNTAIHRVRSCAPAKPYHCWSRLKQSLRASTDQNPNGDPSKSLGVFHQNRYVCEKNYRPTSHNVNFWILFFFLKLTTRFVISQHTTHHRFCQKMGMLKFSSREMRGCLSCLSWQVVRLSGEKHSDKMEEANEVQAKKRTRHVGLCRMD